MLSLTFGLYYKSTMSYYDDRVVSAVYYEHMIEL